MNTKCTKLHFIEEFKHLWEKKISEIFYYSSIFKISFFWIWLRVELFASQRPKPGIYSFHWQSFCLVCCWHKSRMTTVEHHTQACSKTVEPGLLTRWKAMKLVINLVGGTLETIEEIVTHESNRCWALFMNSSACQREGTCGSSGCFCSSKAPHLSGVSSPRSSVQPGSDGHPGWPLPPSLPPAGSRLSGSGRGTGTCFSMCFLICNTVGSWMKYVIVFPESQDGK